MSKAPAFQFYPGDWQRDTGLQMLDHEHKGVWIDLLCFMWHSPMKGRMAMPDGKPIPDARIAASLGLEEAHWKHIRSNLIEYGVTSEDGAGCLISRRMVRDEDIRLKKVEAGRKGGKRSKPPSKKEAPPEAKRGSASATASATALPTVDKSTGASPDVENSVGDVFAPLVRGHLWQSKNPPDSAPNGWNMGRELNVVKHLLREFDSELLADAFTRYRGDPISSVVWWKKGNRGGLNTLIGEARKSWEAEGNSVASILRNMAEGAA